MNGRVFLFRSSGNPLAQIVSVLVFVVLLVGALIMGTVVIALLLGLALIGGLVFAARLWWLQRKLRAAPRFDRDAEPPGSADGKRLIEAEYEVIERDADTDTEQAADAERRRRPQ